VLLRHHDITIAPRFFLRLRRFISHLLTYLLNYLYCIVVEEIRHESDADEEEDATTLSAYVTAAAAAAVTAPAFDDNDTSSDVSDSRLASSHLLVPACVFAVL